MLRKMGWDPGFGGNKVAEVCRRDDGGPELVSFCLRSVVGVGETDAGALDLALRQAGVRGKRRTTPYVVEVEGAACMLDTEQLCMVIRGVRKRGSRVVTVSYGGSMAEDPAAKAEFLATVNADE